MRTTIYQTNQMNHIAGNADTRSNGDFANSEFLYTDNVAWGRATKTPFARHSILIVLEAVSGTPVPRTAVVTGARIKFVASRVDSTAFSADTSLLADDGKWTQPGSGTAQWIGHPNSHLDFQFQCETAGAATLGITATGIAVDGSVTHSENDDLWLTSDSLCQTFTADATGTVATTNLVVWKVEGGSAFDPGDAMRPEYYNTLSQDGTDDRPDIDGGSIGLGDYQAMSTIATSESVISFDHTTGSGITADVVSGTRYAVVLAKNWTGNTSAGTHVLWGFKANTTGASLYPNGSPSTYGIPEAFNNVNYPIDVDLPTQIHEDGVTENVAPFGSVSRDSMPSFLTISGIVTHSSSGITEVMQEYFNRPDYDASVPIGLCMGPGDADSGDQRLNASMDGEDATLDTRIKIEIDWRRRRITRA